MQFVNAQKGPVLRNNKYINKYITPGGKMPRPACQRFIPYLSLFKTLLRRRGRVFIRSREFIRVLEDPQRQFN